jgi:hypothetical protein
MMNVPKRDIDEEMDDLKQEIERFRQEKERVRAIIGQIGGVPTFHTKAFNIVFVVLLIVSVAISLLSDGRLQLAMVELAITAVSIKLLYLVNSQNRVSHFQLWILSSLEWQINELSKVIHSLKKQVD